MTWDRYAANLRTIFTFKKFVIGLMLVAFVPSLFLNYSGMYRDLYQTNPCFNSDGHAINIVHMPFFRPGETTAMEYSQAFGQHGVHAWNSRMVQSRDPTSTTYQEASDEHDAGYRMCYPATAETGPRGHFAFEVAAVATALAASRAPYTMSVPWPSDATLAGHGAHIGTATEPAPGNTYENSLPAHIADNEAAALEDHIAPTTPMRLRTCTAETADANAATFASANDECDSNAGGANNLGVFQVSAATGTTSVTGDLNGMPAEPARLTGYTMCQARPDGRPHYFQGARGTLAVAGAAAVALVTGTGELTGAASFDDREANSADDAFNYNNADNFPQAQATPVLMPDACYFTSWDDLTDCQLGYCTDGENNGLRDDDDDEDDDDSGSRNTDYGQHESAAECRKSLKEFFGAQTSSVIGVTIMGIHANMFFIPMILFMFYFAKAANIRSQTWASIYTVLALLMIAAWFAVSVYAITQHTIAAREIGFGSVKKQFGHNSDETSSPSRSHPWRGPGSGMCGMSLMYPADISDPRHSWLAAKTVDMVLQGTNGPSKHEHYGHSATSHKKHTRTAADDMATGSRLGHISQFNSFSGRGRAFADVDPFVENWYDDAAAFDAGTFNAFATADYTPGFRFMFDEGRGLSEAKRLAKRGDLSWHPQLDRDLTDLNRATSTDTELQMSQNQQCVFRHSVMADNLKLYKHSTKFSTSIDGDVDNVHVGGSIYRAYTTLIVVFSLLLGSFLVLMIVSCLNPNLNMLRTVFNQDMDDGGGGTASSAAW